MGCIEECRAALTEILRDSVSKHRAGCAHVGNRLQ